MISKSMLIFTIVTGVITTVCSVVATVDQVVKGDKRAAIAGKAAGRAIAGEE